MRGRHLLLLVAGLGLIGVGLALLAALRVMGAGEEPTTARVVLATWSLASLLVGCLLLVAAAALNWLAALHRQRVLRAAERHLRSSAGAQSHSEDNGRQ